MQCTFISTQLFNFLQPFHIVSINNSGNQSHFAISLQILAEISVSDIIDLSFNLSKYIQYKQTWKLFEVVCLHWHTVIALYRLDRNGKLLILLRILITAVYFKDRNWISKTVCCISNGLENSFLLRILWYSRWGWQSHNNKKNADNCKALCVSCKRNKQHCTLSSNFQICVVFIKNVSFLYLLKISENLQVFWYFQEV